jgi:hypothetical protein
MRFAYLSGHYIPFNWYYKLHLALSLLSIEMLTNIYLCFTGAEGLALGIF